MKRLAPLLLFVAACIGTTGSDLLGFAAYGAGAEGAATAFTTGQGWTVTLTRARLHVGAMYLNRSVPVSGGQERACFLPGIYVAQVLGGMDLDLLSPTPQRRLPACTCAPSPARASAASARAPAWSYSPALA
jgi:hypothetical protein